MSSDASTSSPPPPHVRRLTEQSDGERSAHHRLLIEYLRECRERCPACRYELYNLTSARCPECGEPLMLRVGLERPRLGAFIAGLVGLASGLGFSGLLFAYFFYWLVLAGRWGLDVSILWILGVEAVLSGILLLIWIRVFGRVRRMSGRTRWTLATLLLILPLIYLIIFFTLIE